MSSSFSRNGVNGSYGSDESPTDPAAMFLPVPVVTMPTACAGPGSLNQTCDGTGLPRWQV